MQSVSIVIPCFNASQYIAIAIESVLAQTFPPSEVLVIDDGSTDDSARVAQRLGVSVIQQKNGGECAARNHGVEEARGEWVAFLDADDVWAPTKLEMQLRAVEGRPDVVCVHTDFYLFGATSDETSTPGSVPEAVRKGQYTVETLLLSPMVNSSTAMVRAGLPVRFPLGVRQGGDMIYFTQLSRHGQFAFVPERLAGYRMHAGQVTRNPGAWVEHFQNRFAWIDNQGADLGGPRVEKVKGLLREQVIQWLHLARWNRQWDRYERLREYARTLDWEGKRPRVLDERPLPRCVYLAKDWIDEIWLQKFKKRPVPTANHD